MNTVTGSDVKREGTPAGRDQTGRDENKTKSKNIQLKKQRDLLNCLVPSRLAPSRSFLAGRDGTSNLVPPVSHHWSPAGIAEAGDYSMEATRYNIHFFLNKIDTFTPAEKERWYLYSSSLSDGINAWECIATVVIALHNNRRTHPELPQTFDLLQQRQVE